MQYIDMKLSDKNINCILNHYCNTFVQRLNENQIETIELNANIELFRNIYIFSTNKELIIMYTKKIIREAFKQLHWNSNVGFFGGVSELYYFIKAFVTTTGYFEEELFFLKQYIKLRIPIEIIKNKNKKEKFNELHYDLINGLSGVGMSLLFQNQGDLDEHIIINEIVTYIVDLATVNEKGQMDICKFCVNQENQLIEEDKCLFPNGNLNLGVAHGLVGVALFLSVAYKKGIIVQNQRKLIDIILQTYDDFKMKIKISNGFVYIWPTQLRMEDYIAGIPKEVLRKPRMSWCYGASGISRVLYSVADNINDTVRKEFYYNNLVEISKGSLKDFLLDSPMICHGYAGLLLTLNSINRKRRNIFFVDCIERLKEKIISFYDETLDYGFINQGIVMENNELKKQYYEQNDLLSGAVGVILSLNSLYIDNFLIPIEYKLGML